MKYLILIMLFVSNVWAAESVYVYNTKQNKVEVSRNADQPRAIASITKLMTAMTTLDWDRNLQRQLKLDRRVGSHLPAGSYTRGQLLTAMLVKSDNGAAETLANDYPGGRSAFIADMNRKAKEWDMKNTTFVDASGLGAGNISTAKEVASLVETASGYWLIQEASGKKQVAFETKYRKKIRTISLAHTSGPLLMVFDKVLVSKTGLTSAAGWCVGMMVENSHQHYIVVVLGSKNKTQRLHTVTEIRYNNILDQNLFDIEIPTTY